MNKKTIAAFLGGIALTVAVSTAAPVIKDAVAPKVDAAGTCPITLQPIQSTGNLVFSPFSFYSSDLTNLRAELNDLGAWADGEISSIQSDVSNGKSSLRDKMVSKGASSSLPAVPSFSQLEAAVDEIWNGGVQYQKEHCHTEIIKLELNISPNAGPGGYYTWACSAAHDGKVRIVYHLNTDDDGHSPYCEIGGSTVNTGNSMDSEKTVHAGDTISIHQYCAHWSEPDKDGYIIIAYVY